MSPNPLCSVLSGHSRKTGLSESSKSQTNNDTSMVHSAGRNGRTVSHKMHFFWPNLRCEVIEQMVKSHYLVEFPAQKKEPKWFQNLGRFKKNSSAQWPKKRLKNWTGPCLSLNMVRRNRFLINLQGRQNQKRGLCRVQLVREQLRQVNLLEGSTCFH